MMDKECVHCEGKGIVAFEDVCNKCGGSCMRRLSTTHPLPVDFYGVEVKYSGGYLSTEVSDGVNYSFVLCEKCLADFMKTFKIAPREEEYL